ncbi:MAG: hypothetical protein DRH43_11795 [Deltaproteobacteria bacterium]|nr:MAG: hypothetical protein DRH43_11795 [Deltaproteobacteria bacterium]
MIKQLIFRPQEVSLGLIDVHVGKGISMATGLSKCRFQGVSMYRFTHINIPVFQYMPLWICALTIPY